MVCRDILRISFPILHFSNSLKLFSLLNILPVASHLLSLPIFFIFSLTRAHSPLPFVTCSFTRSCTLVFAALFSILSPLPFQIVFPPFTKLQLLHSIHVNNILYLKCFELCCKRSLKVARPRCLSQYLTFHNKLSLQNLPLHFWDQLLFYPFITTICMCVIHVWETTLDALYTWILLDFFKIYTQ